MVDLGRQQAHACVVAPIGLSRQNGIRRPLAAVRADASRQLDARPRDRYVEGQSSVAAVAFSANGTSKNNNKGETKCESAAC
jgi:hypothetical protein